MPRPLLRVFLITLSGRLENLENPSKVMETVLPLDHWNGKPEKIPGYSIQMLK